MLCLSGFDLYSRWVPLYRAGKISFAYHPTEFFLFFLSDVVLLLLVLPFYKGIRDVKEKISSNENKKTQPD